ncbi:MAG: crossover junction endodeoxyribonuclease RuvC [Desulfobacterota bacterium]|nr:crossover junction endodeoxyribonuclease RuvC [Thermodesulfobacteriota bacterium]
MADHSRIHAYRGLGIDPGLAHTGYAVIGSFVNGGELCAWGSITTSSRFSIQERLNTIYEQLQKLIVQWKPDLLALEDVYVYNMYPKAAIQLGEVRGVVYLAASHHNISIRMIRPTEVKSCLTGSGRASKGEVQLSVRRILNIDRPIKPDHASDAAALALIAMSRSGYYQW